VAAALIDVQGFTTLAERLSGADRAGVEHLARMINHHFGHVVEEIHRNAGEAHRFPGDSVIAVWLAENDDLSDATHRALCCARELIARATDTGKELPLKVGIGAGDAVLAHVGEVGGKRELLLGGAAFEQMGFAEKLARAGDVVLTPTAWNLVADHAAMRETRDGFIVVDDVGAADPRPAWPGVRAAADPASQRVSLARRYLPDGLLRQLDAGQIEWLGEFRDVAVLFVRLGSALISETLDAVALHRVFCRIQARIDEHEGSITRLAHDDKGIHVLGAFGLPPRTHQDDAERAIRAALTICEDVAGAGVPCHVGVAFGRAYCGPVGGRDRREYSIVGTVANRAARLAMAAATHGVLCDAATTKATAQRVDFHSPISAPALGGDAFLPLLRAERHGRAGERGTPKVGTGYREAMVGRETERARIGAWLAEVPGAGPRALVLRGEPGVGKSRLLESALEQAAVAGIDRLVESCDPMERLAPYHPWRALTLQLLGLSDAVARESWPAAVRARVRDLTGDDVLAPLLAPIVDVAIDDSDTTQTMAGALRRDNTVAILVGLLIEHRKDRARSAPLVVAIEDVHWMDSASWAVIGTTLRQRAGADVSFLLTMRPEDLSMGEATAVMEWPQTRTLEVAELSVEETAEMVRGQLGACRVAPELMANIFEHTKGNPLLCQEYVKALGESGLVEVFDGIAAARPYTRHDDLLMPTSIRAVLTTRIDHLSAPAQLTLKLASVAGQRFERDLLIAAHPRHETQASIGAELDELVAAGLIEPSTAPDRYHFRHALLRDVAYELMLFSQRAELHRAVAENLEERGISDIGEGVLLHHWRAAGDVQKALSHLNAAGSDAMRQGSYHEAMELFDYGLQMSSKLDEGTAHPVSHAIMALWKAQLGEAQVALGLHDAARGNLIAALGLLGHPVRAGSLGLVSDVTGQLGRQAFHRLAGRRRWPRMPEPSIFPAAAVAYEQMGYIHYSAGETLPGVCAAIKMLNLSERARPTPVLARSYAAMSLATGLVGLRRLADAYERSAVACATNLGDPTTEAHVHWVAALRAAGEGRWEQVEDASAHALALAERSRDDRLRIMILSTRASGALLRGDVERARMFGEQALDTAFAKGNRLWEAWALGGLAEVSLVLGDVERTVRTCERAVAIYADESDRAEELRVSGLLALAVLRGGDRDRARLLARGTLDRARAGNLTAFQAYAGIAEAAEALLDLAQHDGHAGGALNLETRRDVRAACAGLRSFARVFPIGRPRHALARARALALSGHGWLARTAFRRAAALAAAKQMPYERARIAAHSGISGISGLFGREKRGPKVA
jgi:class 3 adenylate cyclase/tetratricopeptide (TPR) repeat protein